MTEKDTVTSSRRYLIHTILMDEMVPLVRDVACLDKDSRVLVHWIETGHE